MRPRYNRNNPLQGSHLTACQKAPRPLKCGNLPNRPALLHAAQPGIVVPSPPEPELVLEDEISTDELNRFALCCIERLACSNKHQPLEQLLAKAIAEKLPSYSALKAQFLTSRHQHRSQHIWTKRMVDAVEPLLKSKFDTASVSGLKELSDLAVQSVEQTMQMKYRVNQLKRRLQFLGTAAVQNLLQVGQEIGFPNDLVQKLANLTQTALDQYEPT